MKIVRVIARLNVGGPAKHVVWLTEGLQSNDCESLLVAGTVPRGEEDMGYFAAAHGVKPFLIQEMSREVSFKDLLTIWKLYRLFLRERPDIVHTHTAKAGTVGRIAGLMYRWLVPTIILGRPRQCRFVHTYHGHIFHSYYGPLKTRLFLSIEKILARMITDKIVVVSEQQRREIHDVFGVGQRSQFVVIPLGLDLSDFENGRERRELFRTELGVEPDEILVGIVGRLTEIKNHDLFLHAVRRFTEQGTADPSKRVKFVVIGDGELRTELETQAKRLNLNDRVIFTGGRQDPETFYPGLDIVALTSRNEGTPLTLIEAMANARSVLATAVGGVVDLLGETVSQDQDERYEICERGVRVIPGDADAFAAGLQRLVNDGELRRKISDRGFHFVQTNYSKARLLEDIKALYGDLLERRIPLRAPSSERSWNQLS